MRPAMMPALQLLATQGGGDVVDLRDLEGQRQRAVLQHVGQLGGGLLGEVAGDLRPASGDGRAHRRRRDHLAVEHDGEPVLRLLRWARARVAFSKAVAALRVELQVDHPLRPGSAGCRRWRWSAGCPRSGSGRAGTSRSSPVAGEQRLVGDVREPRVTAGERGEVGLVGLARLPLDRLVRRRSLPRRGRPRRRGRRRRGRQLRQRARPVVAARRLAAGSLAASWARR